MIRAIKNKTRLAPGNGCPGSPGGTTAAPGEGGNGCPGAPERFEPCMIIRQVSTLHAYQIGCFPTRLTFFLKNVSLYVYYVDCFPTNLIFFSQNCHPARLFDILVYQIGKVPTSLWKSLFNLFRQAKTSIKVFLPKIKVHNS